MRTTLHDRAVALAKMDNPKCTWDTLAADVKHSYYRRAEAVMYPRAAVYPGLYDFRFNGKTIAKVTDTQLRAMLHDPEQRICEQVDDDGKISLAPSVGTDLRYIDKFLAKHGCVPDMSPFRELLAKLKQE